MNPDSKSISRRGNRFPAGFPGTLHVLGRDLACDVHDLSRGGVFVTGDIPALAPGERVDLTLSAPAGGLEFRTGARVVRHTPPSPSGSGGLALEFLELADHQRDVLEAVIARLLEGHPPTALTGLHHASPPVEVRKALDAIPLTQRITLAGRASPQEREFLRQDSNSAVLEALLRNPGLRSNEAHAIAASPYLLPATLEIFLADSRWSADEEIRRLIAIHPRTPLPLAERAIANLKVPTLKKVLQAPSLNPHLREKVLRRILHQG